MGGREKEISSVQRHITCFKERRGEEVSKEISHRWPTGPLRGDHKPEFVAAMFSAMKWLSNVGHKK